jgi:glycosyltransferase involved in cell wall biosynthesis
MSPGLRSLHLIGSLKPSHGGPTRSVTRLCDALNALGAPAEIATVAAPDEECPATEKTPIHSFPVAWPERIRRSPALSDFLSAEARRFDLIHVHGLWQWPGVAGRKAARRHDLPLVISPRGMLEPWSLRQRAGIKRVALRTWEGGNLKASRLLHATSEAEAARLRSLGLTQRTCVIPNGVERPSSLVAARGDRGGNSILFLSRFHAVKGGDLLVRAWARLLREFPAWRLDLVGPDPDGVREEWEELARSLRIPPERIRFGGPVDGVEKWNLLSSASLLVLPSHSESFGNVVLEALACGVPVIATQGTPWAGVREHGCGWWVPCDEESLREALCSALSLPAEERKAMGRRGEAWSLEFSWTATAQAMTRAYRSIGREKEPA